MFPIYHFSKLKEFFHLVSLSFSFESFGFRKLGILNRNCWWNLQQMWSDYKICEQGTPLPWTLVEFYAKYPIPQRLVSLCLLNLEPRRKEELSSFCFNHNKIDNAFLCHLLKPDVKKVECKELWRHWQDKRNSYHFHRNLKQKHRLIAMGNPHF